MLGSMVDRVLSEEESLQVVRSTRSGEHDALAFDAGRDSIEELLDAVRCDWIVNAIGVLAGDIDEEDARSVATAIDVNAAFPHRLAWAAGRERRMIHVSTDGVFSGRNAPCDEGSRHDACGVYGRSKSLGEPKGPNVITLRCSIVGPEEGRPRSLLGWALSQPEGARITGYANHRWNGLTTYHLARMCQAVITADGRGLPSPLHLVPADSVSKAELLEISLSAFGRGDVTVSAAPARVPSERTLATIHPDTNRLLWEAAGYEGAPSIAQMVGELACLEE